MRFGCWIFFRSLDLPFFFFFSFFWFGDSLGTMQVARHYIECCFSEGEDTVPFFSRIFARRSSPSFSTVLLVLVCNSQDSCAQYT